MYTRIIHGEGTKSFHEALMIEGFGLGAICVGDEVYMYYGNEMVRINPQNKTLEKAITIDEAIGDKSWLFLIEREVRS